MSDWPTLFGYEKIEWEDLIWHWLIHDETETFGMREWGVILDGLLQKLSETLGLPLFIDEVTYDIEGELQSIDFVIRYYSKVFQPDIVAHAHAKLAETDGQRHFEGLADFSFAFKNVRLIGENGESNYRYEIDRTDNGKTIWKPIGWIKRD